MELLCNIHASMRGFIYVVDSAYYTQPLVVGPGGSQGLTVNIPNDHTPSVVAPDKYGHPRQLQLGY